MAKERLPIMSAEQKQNAVQAAMVSSPIITVLFALMIMAKEFGIISGADPEEIVKTEQRWAAMEQSIAQINFKLETLSRHLEETERNYMTREVFTEWLQSAREANPTLKLPNPPRQ